MHGSVEFDFSTDAAQVVSCLDIGARGLSRASLLYSLRQRKLLPFRHLFALTVEVYLLNLTFEQTEYARREAQRC